LKEETLEDGSRTVLEITFMVLRLRRQQYCHWLKDGLPDIAHKIIEDLKWDFNVAYDEKDAVGRRYRRQDALGTHFVLPDHQTIEDQTVTIRHRDNETRPCKIMNKLLLRMRFHENWLMKM
jgi:glycyl-tRNA synthetase